MEVFRIDPVGKLLGSFNIRDFEKGIIEHMVSDILFLKFICQKVMAVHIELEAERRPGGDTQITQSKFFVNEIEVIGGIYFGQT